MKVDRGGIVLVDFPFTTGGAKERPALVVQNDRDNVRMTNTIVAQISSNTPRLDEPTQFQIDHCPKLALGLQRADPDGRGSPSSSLNGFHNGVWITK